MRPSRPRRIARQLFTAAAFATASLVPAWAADEVELYYSYFEDDDGLVVKSPGVALSKDLTESATVGFKYLFENFSKSAPEGALDAVSGATTVAGGTGSGFSEDRHELGASGEYRFGLNSVAAGYVHSTEKDFESEAVSFAYTRELMQRNLTLTAAYALTQDSVDKLDATAGEGFPKDKDTHGITLAATRLLSRTAYLTAGYAYALVEGYQANPTRRLVIERRFSESAPILETHPDERTRQTLFVRGLKYFHTRTSGDLNLAYYTDDWGVDATTAELRLNQYITPKWIGRVRYRWYSQGEADFYKETYRAAQQYMTADMRLRPFDSTLAGLKLTYYPRGAGISALHLALSVDRYRETHHGVEADVYQASVRIPY